MFRDDPNWHLVFVMLRHCPKLQFLILNMETSSADAVWTPIRVVPKCLSSRLRKCSIMNFEGTESELQFLKYIMQNSVVLRTMAIDTKPSSKLQDKFEMLKELSLCPRGSTICELSFK